MPRKRCLIQMMLCMGFLSIPFSLNAADGQSTLVKENEILQSTQGSLPGLAEPVSQGPLTRNEKLKRAKFYYAAGESYIKEGNFVAADEAFKKAQVLLQETALENDTAATIQKNQTEVTESQAKTSEVSTSVKYSIDEYRTMLQRHPYSSDIYYNLALEYLKLNQFSDATEAFKKVIALHPKDYEAYYNLGVLYEYYLGDKQQALSFYQTYLKLVPQAADAEQVRKWIQEITATEPMLK